MASAGIAKAIENPTVLQAVTRLLPNFVMHQPATGMAQTEPIAVPNRQSPRRALVNSSALCTAGMRETQVETIRPWRRKREITAHHADENLFRETTFESVSCAVSTI